MRIELLDDEQWWGGAVADGRLMPFGGFPYQRDLATSAGPNEDLLSGASQSAPLLVSSRGRYVWSERPFAFEFDGEGHLMVGGTDLVVRAAGGTFRDAFRAASAKHFPSEGRAPAVQMFTAPQYNTWIEIPYNPTQAGVLDYARSAVQAGFPPGVLMIDDKWCVITATGISNQASFPDPRGMLDELHALGFSVMLWIVPYLSPDSAVSRVAEANGWLIASADGSTAVRKWWNGYSTVLDLTNPEAVGWLRNTLRELMDLDGVDGFKFDGGDIQGYRADDRTQSGGGGVDQCEAWAKLASEFTFNELRACWKMGGQPLGQRFRDKPPTWGAHGLRSLIPESAPVLEKGATKREIEVPVGRWRPFEGEVVAGPLRFTLGVELETVPWLERLSA